MPAKLHPLTSDHVRDQLALRTVTANGVRTQPEGVYVLYWMQSTHRFEENWALRQAILHADRLGKPLLVHQGLDPTYEHANDRIHTVILENARALHRRSADLGFSYQFVLRRRRDDDRRVVDRLAARAALVVTDRFPTAGIAERTARFAERAPCRVDLVESHGIVPSGALLARLRVRSISAFSAFAPPKAFSTSTPPGTSDARAARRYASRSARAWKIHHEKLSAHATSTSGFCGRRTSERTSVTRFATPRT